MDDLLLIFQPDGLLFTGRVLYNDANGGERGAIELSAFEKVPFSLMLARLAAEVSIFIGKEEKIGVAIQRADLSLPATRLDEETILLLHADPVAVIRSLCPAPTKIFVRRADPASLSPLRIGFDALAATFGDEVFIRRRGDQAECPCCGLWADIHGYELELRHVSACRSMACGVKLPIALRGDRWASVTTKALLTSPDREKFFFPREWNTHGPWITREDLETKRRDWTAIKKEFSA